MSFIKPIIRTGFLLIAGHSVAFAASFMNATEENISAKNQAYTLSEIASFTDDKGNQAVRYEQHYQGIPIFAYQVTEHHSANSFVANGTAGERFAGTLVRDLDKDIQVQGFAAPQSADAALSNMKTFYANAKDVSLDHLNFDNESSRQMIYVDEQNKGHLSYVVSFYVEAEEQNHYARPYYIVDANTLKILKTWDGLTTERYVAGPGGNERIGFYTYGYELPLLDISRNWYGCSFENGFGKTVHLRGGSFGSRTYNFNCRDTNYHNLDAINGAASPVNDAHYFMELISRFYGEWFNTAPLPFPLVMRTHMGRDFANAFWNGKTMTFGNGDQNTYPFVLLDIAAHEVAHGVTENASGLVYENQSGGLNESFSDMASVAMEYYLTGDSGWTLGGGVFKDLNRKALRYLDDPTKDGVSINHVSDYYDGLNVHYSSGVFNHAFYVLANSPGWNIGKAFDVMYYANKMRWKPNHTFELAAWDVVLTAADRGYDQATVISAFENVGIYCSLEEKACGV